MIYFVDGLQNVGKTTLSASLDIPYIRFNFDKYLHQFGLEHEIDGFQHGKDLGILSVLKYVDKDLILDRGPIATAFYSIKCDRWLDEHVDEFFKEIAQMGDYTYVVINKINAPKLQRNRKDGFDYLNDDVDDSSELLKAIISIGRKNGMRIVEFINDFGQSKTWNCIRFREFLLGLKHEHK